MKFQGGGGGAFAKFEKPGDKYAGVVAGTRELPNKFQNGAMQTVIDLVTRGGDKITVRLDKKALIDAWATAVAKCGNLTGRYVTFEFERTYQSKRGGQPGKDITVDVADVAEQNGSTIAGEAQQPTGPSPIEEAYAKVVAARGAEQAAQIRKAVESVERDPVKQAVLLLKAVGA